MSQLYEKLTGAFERTFEKLSAAMQTQFTKLAALQERMLQSISELVKRLETPAAPVTPPPPPTNAATSLAPSGGFLWKPKAEKDGKLVVLLPKELGRVSSVRILSPDGSTELAKGRFSSIANGNRAHYRFQSAGANFPDGAVVEITKKDGKKEQIAIPDTAVRFKY